MTTPEHPPRRLTRRVGWTGQHSRQPVVLHRAVPAAGRQQRTKIRRQLVRQDRVPPADTRAGAARDGGGQQQATEARAGHAEARRVVDEGVPLKDAFSRSEHQWGRVLVLDQPTPYYRGVPEWCTRAAPDASLRAIPGLPPHTARLVVRLFLRDGREDAGVELSVVARQVQIPLGGGDSLKAHLVGAVEEAFQVSGLPQQAIQVVRDERVRLAQIIEQTVERWAGPRLVGGHVVVLVEAFLACIPGPSLGHFAAVAELTRDPCS